MNVIGLDLGTSNIKAVEVKREKGKVELVKYGLLESINANLNSDKEEDITNYIKALNNFFNEHNFSSNSVIVGLPESSVFTRIIVVPKMNQKELKSAITFEAEQYIPIPLKDVSYDFQVIDNDDPEDKTHMTVLLVAATKSLVSKYLRILKESHLTPQGLEPEVLALTRVIGDTHAQPNPSILVNIAADSTNVIVSYKGVVRFSRNISTGGDAMTRAVSQELGFDFSQAEEYKKTYGLDSTQVDGKVFNAIKPVFDTILNEIKRTFYFYTTHNPGVNIRRVVVCGGTALMPGLLYYLTTNLDLEVELASPWQKVTFPPKFDNEKHDIMSKGASFVTAVGLALKE